MAVEALGGVFFLSLGCLDSGQLKSFCWSHHAPGFYEYHISIHVGGVFVGVCMWGGCTMIYVVLNVLMFWIGCLSSEWVMCGVWCKCALVVIGKELSVM